MFKLIGQKKFSDVSLGSQEFRRLDVYVMELHSYLLDESLSEIYLHSSTQRSLENDALCIDTINIFWSVDKVADLIAELSWECRVRIDPYRPYGGGVIPGQTWRWHAVIAPMASDGPMVVFRRQRFETLNLDAFQFNQVTPSELNDAINRQISLVIFGATGSGKTSFLTSMLKSYFSEVRIGIGESVEEIPLLSKYWFRILEISPDSSGRGGVPMSKVLSEMMRLSPKLLVVGELRGDECRAFADIARTGHGGVITTLHAGNFDDARNRLVTLAGMDLNCFPKLCGVHIQKLVQGFTVTSQMLN
jgi:pilus assembly protein CpaF